jgi:hypothetical protein
LRIYDLRSRKEKGLKEAKEKLDVMKLPPEEQGIYENYLEDLHLNCNY